MILLTKLLTTMVATSLAIVTPIAAQSNTYKPTQHKIEIEKGVPISVVPMHPANPFAVAPTECTLTAVTDKHSAITARHCGAVGDEVYVQHTLIGHITKHHTGTYDVAYITFLNNVNAKISKINKTYPKIGTPIHKIGATTGLTYGKVVPTIDISAPVSNGLFHSPEILTVDQVQIKSTQGDSGAPILNEQDEVLGLITATSAINQALGDNGLSFITESMHF